MTTKTLRKILFMRSLERSLLDRYNLFHLFFLYWTDITAPTLKNKIYTFNEQSTMTPSTPILVSVVSNVFKALEKSCR